MCLNTQEKHETFEFVIAKSKENESPVVYEKQMREYIKTRFKKDLSRFALTDLYLYLENKDCNAFIGGVVPTSSC